MGKSIAIPVKSTYNISVDNLEGVDKTIKERIT